MAQILCPSIVGRAGEIATLSRCAGGAGAWFIAGEAGIGKSRLVREALDGARAAGAVTLTGRAVDADRSPLRPVAEILLAALNEGADPSARAVAPLRGVLGSLVPAIGEGTDAPSPLVLAEAVRRLLATLPEPRVAAVEDLHWADDDTLAVIEHLASSGDVAIIGTLRPSSEGALSLARRMHAGRGATLIELGPLDDAAVVEMIADALGAGDPPAALCGFVSEHADGVPFLVEELLTDAASRATLVRDGEWTFDSAHTPTAPPTFDAAVGERLERLSPGARDFAGAASLLGREFDWVVVASALGLDESSALAAVRECLDASLIVEAGDGYRFRHALSREAVRRRMLAPVRQRQAAALVGAIRTLQPRLEGSWCALAARLSVEGGDAHQAATLYVEGARRAMSAGALAGAREALAEADSLTGGDLELSALVQELLLEVATLQGEATRVLTDVEAVVRLLAAVEAPAARIAAAHFVAARAAVGADEWGIARRHLDAASAHADPSDAAFACNIRLAESHLALADGRNADALALSSSAFEVAERLGLTVVACEAQEVIGRVHRLSDLPLAMEAFERALAIATRAGHAQYRARALHEIGTIEILRESGIVSLLAAREAADEAGDLRLGAVIDAQLAGSHLVRGHVAEAADVAERSISTSQRLGLAGTHSIGIVMRAMVLSMGPDRAALENTITEALAVSDDAPMVRAVTVGARGMWALFNEDRDLARRALDESMRLTASTPGVPPSMFRVAQPLIRALADDDARAAIAAAATPDVVVVRAWTGFLHAAEAVLAGKRGDAEAAEREAGLWREAFDAVEESDVWRHLAGRLMAEGALADGWGTPVEWLGDAETYFAAEGYAALARACRGMLGRAGVKLRRKGRGASEVPDSLAARGVTSREVDVLRLIAEGLTNNQIAERLFLSSRTVGGHVARMLDKLGCENRAQLAALAAAAGLGAAPAAGLGNAPGGAPGATPGAAPSLRER